MTVASLLRQQGYRTACVGKWHLGLGWATTDGVIPSDRSDEPGANIDYSRPISDGPLTHGFDYFYGIPASLDMVPYVFIENDRVEAPPAEQIEGRGGLAFYRAGPAAPGFDHEQTLPILTGRAVAFIDDQAAARPDEPFFLYFPLPSPHTPVLPVAEYRGQSRAGAYGDFVAQTDGTIGAVLDALDRNGLTRDTLVIVTSDNGSTMTPMDEYGHLPNDGLRGRKSDVWDGGHRIPFLACWPGVVPAGTICSETICLTDLLATCADVTGAALPSDAGEDSWSILPALRGGDAGPLREATVHHSIEGMFAIRQGRWKLIEGRGSGGWTAGGEEDPAPGQLYDLIDDIDEEVNLYRALPETVAALTTLLERYRSEGRSTPISR
jgi:arylsulfatase A-like enzyme